MRRYNIPLRIRNMNRQKTIVLFQSSNLKHFQLNEYFWYFQKIQNLVVFIVLIFHLFSTRERERERYRKKRIVCTTHQLQFQPMRFSFQLPFKRFFVEIEKLNFSFHLFRVQKKKTCLLNFPYSTHAAQR